MKKPNVHKLIMLLLMCSVNVWAEDIAFTEKSSAEYLKLIPPVQVLKIIRYRDGGSIEILLTDATTNVFAMYANASITSYRLKEEGKPNDFGRVSFGSENAMKLISEEKEQRVYDAVICLAIAWVDREFTSEEQRRLREANFSHQLIEQMFPSGKREKGKPWDENTRRDRFDAAMYIVYAFKKMPLEKTGATELKP